MKNPRPHPLLPPPFVGDLSTRDAVLLADLATHGNVLEHGAGGSTQIFAQVANAVISVEPVPAWQATTRDNLDRIRGHGYVCAPVTFLADFVEHGAALRARAPYSLIFVDGPSADRDAFAHAAFPLLASEGTLVFHDTRVPHERARALRLVETFSTYIETVAFNPHGTNLTLVRRTVGPARYSNWNTDEGREEWEAGRVEPPPEWLPYVLARSARILGLDLAAPETARPPP